jgi:rhodanese-related sulfurtransferase
MSSGEGRKVDLVYNDIVDILTSNSATLIDVRNPDELQQNGRYPSGFNIPRESKLIGIN